MKQIFVISIVCLVPAAVAAQESVPVQVVRPELRKIARAVEQPGSVRADLEAPLAAKLTGYVRSVYKDIGDVVKMGDRETES